MSDQLISTLLTLVGMFGVAALGTFALLERLDRIHELALPVYHAIGEAVRQYVLAHGVDPLEIDREFLRDLFGDER